MGETPKDTNLPSEHPDSSDPDGRPPTMPEMPLRPSLSADSSKRPPTMPEMPIEPSVSGKVGDETVPIAGLTDQKINETFEPNPLDGDTDPIEAVDTTETRVMGTLSLQKQRMILEDDLINTSKNLVENPFSVDLNNEVLENKKRNLEKIKDKLEEENSRKLADQDNEGS